MNGRSSQVAPCIMYRQAIIQLDIAQWEGYSCHGSLTSAVACGCDPGTTWSRLVWLGYGGQVRALFFGEGGGAKTCVSAKRSQLGNALDRM